MIYNACSRIIWSLCIASISACAVNKSPSITADIVDYGIERRDNERIIDDTNSPSGKTRLMKEFVFRERTTIVPAVLGVAFSMCVEIRGLARSQWSQVKNEVSFPPMLSPDGVTHTSAIHEARFRLGNDSSVLTCSGYGLDHPFEIVPGEWILSVTLSGKTLATKSFLLQ
jgi:hypothetical protein